MAANNFSTPASQLEKKRQKKNNFTLDEVLLIQEEVEKNYITINAKYSNAVTNDKKRKVWEKIAQKCSALGIATRTAKEIKDKWNNTKKIAKKTYTEYQRESNKTGGGPPPKPINQAVGNVIDMCRDSASFKGIEGGFESSFEMDAPTTESDIPQEEASTQDVFESFDTEFSSSPIFRNDQSLLFHSLPASPSILDHPRPSTSFDHPRPSTSFDHPRPSTSSDHPRPSTSSNQTHTSTSLDHPRPITTTPMSSNPTGYQRAPKKLLQKRTKKTADDVYDLQCRMLEKELIKQDKQIIKLDLQIALLKQLQTSTSPQTPPTLSQLFASM